MEKKTGDFISAFDWLSLYYGGGVGGLVFNTDNSIVVIMKT